MYLYAFMFILAAFKLFALPSNIPFAYQDSQKNYTFRSIYQMPERFDPATSYDGETIFLLEQIYEPLYTFKYLAKTPELEPVLAAKLPKLTFYNERGQEIHDLKKDVVAKTVYTIAIRPHVYYQKNPYLKKREVLAKDFVYAILRTKNAGVSSPIRPILKKYIWGYQEYIEQADLNSIAGVRALDDYTLEITTHAYHSQWIYWLTKVFFAPIPQELAERYHGRDKSIWRQYSIGTGPFMLFNDVSEQKITLQKNPDYRDERFSIDAKTVPDVYLKNIGHQLPLSDGVVFVIERELIPKWKKFLQGYYDVSFIPAQSFESFVELNKQGGYQFNSKFINKNFQLKQLASDSNYALGFNMLDKTYGGYSKRARTLRQAISIAFDFEEFSNIFFNGRASVAHDLIPGGILGSARLPEEYNPYLFDMEASGPKKKSLAYAKQLLAEAGYPNGIDPKTHRALILHLDITSSGLPEEKARFDWYRKQMRAIGIDLDIRISDENRFKQKLDNGSTQFFPYAWSADYPDAENFLLLYYSKNQKKKYGGPNYSNYANLEFDKLYEELCLITDLEKRRILLRKMVAILQKDCVTVWGTHANSLVLYQVWVSPYWPNSFSSGILKYMHIDSDLRLKLWSQWNPFKIMPLCMGFLILILGILPFYLERLRLRRQKARRTPF